MEKKFCEETDKGQVFISLVFYFYFKLMFYLEFCNFCA